MKAIILIPCTSRFAPGKIGAFIWSHEHSAHIYEGRELEPEEFNSVVDKVLGDENHYIRPTVRMIMGTPEVVVFAPAEPVAITAAVEMTKPVEKIEKQKTERKQNHECLI